ncbi:MAG: biotin--[acetyl-CoA-carboxylase] ligase, partial [Methylococcales bacterium]
MSVFSSAFLLFPSLSKSGSRFEKIGANWILKGSSDFFGYCMMPPQVIFSETHEPSSPRKKLLGLLSDGRFHSGTSLADELGLSRTSVWKQVAGLGELGIRIDAVSGRGYRLCRALELLDETMIRSGLEADVINEIGCFHIHDLIDSTNRCLVSALTEPGSKGAVCLAESQSAGKGRNGKSWVSPFGSNVYLSLTWHYPDGPAALSGLSLAVGVAVVRALSSLNVRDIRLKWPNDILWNEKKVGGILIEVFGDAHGPCSVIIGLGLNHAMSLDQGAAIDQQWVDLDTITHHAQPGRNLLVASLINEMLRIVSGFNQ